MSQTNSYGYASEVKVHVIGGRSKEQNLTNEIEEWLREHATAEILDIKYGYSITGGASTGYYSAMIVYRS